METKEEFGTKLRNTRKSRGFTLKEVAEEVGVSESMVSRWENGVNDVRKTRASILAKLCKMLGMDIEEFTDVSIAQSMMIQSVNDMAMNLDEPTLELMYAILDLSPIQKMTILQMIRAMTGGKDE